MAHHRNDWRGGLKVALVAACVAVAGQAMILSDDFGVGDNSLNSDSARIVTAAAVSKVGATETWPERGPHFAQMLTGPAAAR
jgi:hypothetical protein